MKYEKYFKFDGVKHFTKVEVVNRDFEVVQLYIHLKLGHRLLKRDDNTVGLLRLATDLEEYGPRLIEWSDNLPEDEKIFTQVDTDGPLGKALWDLYDATNLIARSNERIALGISNIAEFEKLLSNETSTKIANEIKLTSAIEKKASSEAALAAM